MAIDGKEIEKVKIVTLYTLVQVLRLTQHWTEKLVVGLVKLQSRFLD